ncbi:MAG: hypothetical protein HYX61_03380 [Gammaproteobacteria bacterium]|jgi:hypothetical protein|nr:hypothetical protein [Gammaproteobacteria bacterium]
MKYQSLFFIVIVLLPSAIFAEGKPLTDGDIRNYILSGNLSTFTEECPCPYSLDNKKNVCGENSEYVKNPGTLKCYPGDVTDEEVRQYRRDNNTEKPYLPWNKEKKEGY